MAQALCDGDAGRRALSQRAGVDSEARGPHEERFIQ